MPTRAGCGLCDWSEDFRDWRDAKESAGKHRCEEEANLPVWIKDVSWEESDLE